MELELNIDRYEYKYARRAFFDDFLPELTNLVLLNLLYIVTL